MLHEGISRALIGLAAVGLLSCTPRLTSRLSLATDWELDASTAKAVACATTDHYTPDTTHLGFWPMRKIRVNFHVMLHEGGKDFPDSTAMVYRARDIVSLANDWLSRKTRPWLPRDNPPPGIDPRWRYVVTPQPGVPDDTGVYLHVDDEVPYHVHTGKNQNRGNSLAYDRYALGADTILNIFLLAHHPDSIRSRRYKSGVAGVALGSRWVKMFDNWATHRATPPSQNNLIHEVGHIYTLSHTWAQNDGCDDTPRHDNCWNFNEPAGCTEVSNNVMDYNANSIALTPCQIGRVHAVMGREGSRQRAYLQPNWCRGTPGGNVVLSDTLVLNHATDLEGDLTLAPGAYLEVNCRLSIPQGGRITVAPGATLVLAGKLHNSCGLEWDGVVVERQDGLAGRLVYRGQASIDNTSEGALPLAQD